MKESFVLKETFEIEPSFLYHAWLNSDLHGQMTGGEAQCSNYEGGTFSAWDGYITGENIELTKNKKIVQTWRTTEFDEKDEDSTLSIELVEIQGGTAFILTHTNIPEGQSQYKQGWVDHYFSPMKEFISNQK